MSSRNKKQYHRATSDIEDDVEDEEEEDKSQEWEEKRKQILKDIILKQSLRIQEQKDKKNRENDFIPHR